MRTKLSQLKERIKEESKEQRQIKAERKPGFSGKRIIKSSYSPDHLAAAIAAQSNKRDLRHLHLAYCLLLGRELEEIESTTKPWNLKEPRDMDVVKKIMEEYSDEEALRLSA